MTDETIHVHGFSGNMNLHRVTKLTLQPSDCDPNWINVTVEMLDHSDSKNVDIISRFTFTLFSDTPIPVDAQKLRTLSA
jgi:hypothetical protein